MSDHNKPILYISELIVEYKSRVVVTATLILWQAVYEPVLPADCYPSMLPGIDAGQPALNMAAPHLHFHRMWAG